MCKYRYQKAKSFTKIKKNLLSTFGINIVMLVEIADLKYGFLQNRCFRECNNMAVEKNLE